MTKKMNRLLDVCMNQEVRSWYYYPALQLFMIATGW